MKEKRKKVALLLSVVLALSAEKYVQINAEDVVENSFTEDKILEADAENADDEMTEFTGAVEDNSSLSESEESFEDEGTLFSDEEDVLTSGDDTLISEEEILIGGENDSEKEENNSTDGEDSLSEVIPDDTYNLKFYSGSVEQSDIFEGDDVTDTLNVYDVREEQNILTKETDYTVLGYITEEAYLNADHTLDNLNQFCQVPDTAGVWYLVLEGMTPYYGRQAVRIVAHDMTDLSMYSWQIDGEVLAGENPADILQVFLEKEGERVVLEQDDYEVLGYITENEYENVQYDSEKITTFTECPSQAGQWVMVIEGRGEYHGKLFSGVMVKDEYDLGMYQCSLEKEMLETGEQVKDLIKIARERSGREKVVASDQYKILGVITEKEFAESGYDMNNVANIQDFADTPGGWYVLLEGTAPYYGRTVAWFEVEEKCL